MCWNLSQELNPHRSDLLEYGCKSAARSERILDGYHAPLGGRCRQRGGQQVGACGSLHEATAMNIDERRTVIAVVLRPDFQCPYPRKGLFRHARRQVIERGSSELLGEYCAT